MEVKTLTIKNFRGIQSLEIDFHDRMNVFIGENGSGKSAILDLLGIMLSWLTARLRYETSSGRTYSELDITNGESETDNEITIALNGQDVWWRFTKARPGRKRSTPSNFDEIKPVVRQSQDGFEADDNQSLPLIAYYPVTRAVLDIPLRIRGKHVFDQFSAYEDPLTAKNRYFRVFFEWFRNREDIENEAYRTQQQQLFSDGPPDGPRQFPDIQLQAVRMAINAFLPEFKGLTVRRRPRLRMTIVKGTEELEINQLSDGEKCQLAIVGDLARRLAIANPSLDDPLQGRGIVMIDEVELHFHPAWERMIVPGLQGTFPHCQFILTTHSPQVLSHVEHVESVFVLKRDGIHTRKAHPSSIYGNESNRILEDIMGVSERPEKIKTELNALFWEIESGNLMDAKKKIEQLRQQIGDDPELVRASVLIRRKEIIGK